MFKLRASFHKADHKTIILLSSWYKCTIYEYIYMKDHLQLCKTPISLINYYNTECLIAYDIYTTNHMYIDRYVGVCSSYRVTHIIMH